MINPLKGTLKPACTDKSNNLLQNLLATVEMIVKRSVHINNHFAKTQITWHLIQ